MDSANLPVNRTQTFSTNDYAVYSWIDFINVYSPSHSVTWVWLTPQGFIYAKVNGTISDPGPGKYWTNYYLYWYLNIKGYTVGLIPGTWHIEIYTDGVMVLVQNFTVSSQATLFQNQWVNLGPRSMAWDMYSRCYTKSYTLPCPDASSAGKVGAFAYDPSSPGVLYAASGGPPETISFYGAGLFKSSDSGSTWLPIDAGFTGWTAKQIVVQKGNPNVVVALADFAIFKSSDGGASWAETYNGRGFYGTALYRTPNDTLYATSGGTILKSIDFGSTWTTLSSIPVTQDQEIRAIAVLNGGGTIYAEMYLGQRTGEILKSVDGGKAYSASNTFSYGYLSGYGHLGFGEILPSPTDPSTLWVIAFYDYPYSSLLVSHNGGVSFSSVSMSGLGLASSFSLIAAQYITYDPLNANIMYMAGDGWLYKSTNGGQSFLPLSNSSSYVGIDVRLIVVDSTNDNIVYVAGDQGLIRSNDGGTHWTPLNNGRSSTAVYSVAAEDSRIFTTVQDFGEIYSCDSGATWVEDLSSSCTSFPANAYYSAFAEFGYATINPYDRSNVLLYSISFSPYIGHVLFSTNGGGSFGKATLQTTLSAANLDLRPLMVFNSKSPNVVYLAGGEGVYESTDYGRSWQLLNGSPTNAVLGISVQNPSTLYASNPSGLYKSLDGGSSWSFVNNLSFLSTGGSAGATFSSLAVNPLDDSIVVGVVQNSNSISMSNDGGGSFASLSPTPSYFGNTAVYYSNASSTPAIVLTGYEGVLVSLDQGAHWKDYTANLPQPYPAVLSFYLSQNGTAYISTSGTGVWAYKNFFPSVPTPVPQFPDPIAVMTVVILCVGAAIGLTRERSKLRTSRTNLERE